MTLSKNDQFLRKFDLKIGPSGGEGPYRGFDLQNMYFSFEIVKRFTCFPNRGVIRVYNISKDFITFTNIQEGDQIILSAGYEGNYGVIFTGHIAQYRRGWDADSSTSWIEFVAYDGDIGFSKATMNQSFSPEASPQDYIDAVLDSFKKQTGKRLTLKNETDNRFAFILPRGMSTNCQTYEFMNKVADNLSAEWGIQDDMLLIIPKNRGLRQEAAVENIYTGLVGSIEQTIQGMRFKCLLNPRLSLQSRVKLNNNDIIKSERSFNSMNSGFTVFSKFDTDGLYKIIYLTHKGGTRNNDWFTEVTAISLSTTNIAAGETTDNNAP